MLLSMVELKTAAGARHPDARVVADLPCACSREPRATTV
ncbi:hypothetical protein I545_3559 [Mycobacterium kansasii 662]|uniref:Uncharacterized protein n=2 Tax=Mycobacterium kansasii TaxID=1768 RepID=A0A1V3X576_MYCKA|nr:hypothetical protein I547_5696 [Mycobacterium kansasii 824]EUA16934.1 hypothetical protein I545_3559 [Mycobacterium kansasii 662]OOK73996.1 hypothetical protein BZL30_4788 [Mycobacterium kansasii]OOK76879.1 hypothetical protein BZL29_3956 [Mycobacterium kansasii]